MTFHNFILRNPLYQFRDEMDRLVSGFLSPAAEESFSPRPWGQPAANVWEEPDALMVEVEIPGVKKDQLELSVVGKELTIRISRPDAEPESLVYHRRERPVGSFSRVLQLPSEVDVDRVGAELRDGVLTVTLPKAQSAKPRKIVVA